MIFYRGVALEVAAPDIKIEDIRVSPISTTAVSRQRPIAWGADFVRMAGGGRTVTISFAVPIEDADERRRALDAIKCWARSAEPGRLTLPHYGGLYLEAICITLPDPSTRQWWEAKLRVVFATMGNPYWTSEAEKSAPCGTEFCVLGDAPPLMRIVRTLQDAATDQTYSDGAQSMTFSVIPSGEMGIDLNRQTASVDGVSIMGNYAFGSQFLRPQTGVQTITGSGTVVWRERWE